MKSFFKRLLHGLSLVKTIVIIAVVSACVILGFLLLGYFGEKTKDVVPGSAAELEFLGFFVDDYIISGTDKSVVVLEVYSSPLCPACKKFRDKVLPRVVKMSNEIDSLAIEYRDYGHTLPAMQAVMCARAQGDGEGYYAFLNLVMDNQKQLHESSQDSSTVVSPFLTELNDLAQANGYGRGMSRCFAHGETAYGFLKSKKESYASYVSYVPTLRLVNTKSGRDLTIPSEAILDVNRLEKIINQFIKHEGKKKQ